MLLTRSAAITRKTRILGVVYNSTNNELVRTNTLVKNSVIQIDATPFRQWYEQHYGVVLGAKKAVKKVIFLVLCFASQSSDRACAGRDQD